MAEVVRVQAFRLTLLALAGAALTACASTEPKTATLDGLRLAQPLKTADRDSSLYGLFLAGQAALDKGSSQEAADYLAKASALAPEAGFLKARAFSASLLAGDIDRAALDAPGPGEGSPAMLQLGVLARAVEALANGRGREAETLLAAGDGAAPHGAVMALLKPWAAAMAADWDTALAPLPAGVAPDRSMNGLFAALSRAQLLEHAGRFDAADQAYKALADRDGIFAAAYGAFLERRGRRADALALYDRMLARRDDSDVTTARTRAAAGKPPPAAPTFKEGAAEALLGPAAQYLSQNQGDLGLSYLRLALRLDPKMDEAWVLVGDAMAAAGDVGAARESYLRVHTDSAEYATARGRLAWSLNNEDDVEGALKMARETIQAMPTSQEALAVYADLLREDGRYQDAVGAMDQLIERAGPQATWRLYYIRGVVNERAGHWETAQVDLEQALKLNPNSAEALNYLGFGWADRGEHIKQATEMLQKAVMLEPRSGAIVDSFGWALYRNGDFIRAVRELEQAVMLEPADPDVNDHLGDAYWRVGRKLEAQYQWRRVLTLKPDDHTRTAVETKIKAGLPVEGSGPRTEAAAERTEPGIARP